MHSIVSTLPKVALKAQKEPSHSWPLETISKVFQVSKDLKSREGHEEYLLLSGPQYQPRSIAGCREF